MFVVPFFGEEWGRFIIKYQFRALAARRPDAQKADKKRQDGSFSGSICLIYLLVNIKQPHHLLVLQSFISSSKSASVINLHLREEGRVVINLLRVN